MRKENIFSEKHRLIILVAWKPLAAVFVWGASFIATKYALNELRPLTIILLRQFLGIVLLTVIAVIQRKSFGINFKDHGGVAVLALIAAAHLWIQVTGLQYTTATNTGWIIGITPVFMAFWGIAFFKEKLAWIQVAGIVIAFAGLLLLVGKGDITSIDMISNKGDILVLVSAFTWSVYSAVGKKITLSYSPLMTILYLFAMVSIIIAPFAINNESIISVINLSLVGWIAVIFLGLFCSGIAYVLWAQALAEMPSSKAGAFLYIEPFVTVFTAWLLLKEMFSLTTFVGGIIILVGVVLVNKK